MSYVGGRGDISNLCHVYVSYLYNGYTVSATTTHNDYQYISYSQLINILLMELIGTNFHIVSFVLIIYIGRHPNVYIQLSNNIAITGIWIHGKTN